MFNNMRLIQAAKLLQDADAEIQKQLGNTENCFEIHCAIQNVIDDLIAIK
jgi:hypothetical protein